MEEDPFPTEKELEAQMLRLARSGDREAAIDAMRSAAIGLSWRNISPELADYLAQALHAALDAEGGPTGKVLEGAFNLTRKRGERGSKATEDRLNLIAVWVHLAVERGWDEAEAKAQASDVWGYENIDRATRSLDEVLAKEAPGDETWERVFLSYGKPLPPRRQI